ncbi:putative E3 ubiquitin-protein ligase RNF38 isoform X2 [Apostichopus japonicus]|uniref:Putative E3 ubiquitin-protein ligase RNF38 isoform X2 n=1 Tax=Stichopus japonicus TaxID=307972 RepID=A0A2G8KGB2_STIJA|nr:putative E3 ubiquitin-protein ligase RNF38 isoform X2 [Apostichopus japonicus]
MAIQGLDITPQTAAAIQQLEADEDMARRLQLEFDREEATLATPQPRTRRRGPPQRGNRRGRRLANLPRLPNLPPYVEPDQDDYERLLDLAEHLGPAVPQGLAVEVLSRLPTFRFQESDSGHQLKEEDKSCTICMGDYETNEELRRLPCFHAYHTKCIDKWFEQNSACPICRVRVQLD